MQHLEHERLVFLALGESDVAGGEATHLDDCAHCRDELAALRQVAGLGADTQGLADLPDPPEHVWQNIVAELDAARTTAEEIGLHMTGAAAPAAAEETAR